MTTLLCCLVKRYYMFRRTNAIIRELYDPHKLLMSACITGRMMEYRAKWLQSVLLHYEYNSPLLTTAASHNHLYP
jgi:hypothetical protein